MGLAPPGCTCLSFTTLSPFRAADGHGGSDGALLEAHAGTRPAWSASQEPVRAAAPHGCVQMVSTGLAQGAQGGELPGALVLLGSAVLPTTTRSCLPFQAFQGPASRRAVRGPSPSLSGSCCSHVCAGSRRFITAPPPGGAPPKCVAHLSRPQGVQGLQSSEEEVSAGASGETSPRGAWGLQGAGSLWGSGGAGFAPPWRPRSLSLPGQWPWDRSCTGQGGDERSEGK